ncbi:protein of unknown function UPF0066 [Methanococcus aeolicus Nankai-3]|uniref:TsaA-like domain-containing protein n=1 Tax=Methanococcus aeolicus (strain ATCC BAA-1280 / DSM 17508 / OCM 812 / Nankai-3) TaxID=419665 RepID=A6UV99_META3|nr:tRNA (N6-threonylcarbamoyladenosine(37)-N6)-methyltransferase TrmO [Methanococcus aeolicus]ABR56421.1 protein of unknown function UPF0066 [Methanococcus aeolicus Nankai-3]
MKSSFKIYAIGNINQIKDKTILNIFKEYSDGLAGLKEKTKISLLLWFDKSDTPEKRKILKVHPRGDTKKPIRGVFSTRSPFRPNPIAVYETDILKIEENKIYIDKIDAFENTPIIDIKIGMEQ